jgi:cytochrome c biogenesis protein CcmG/thiol:disulfide interchange protein DsbE
MRKLLVASMVFLIAAASGGCEGTEEALEPAEIGKKAPPFALEDLGGRTVRLSDHEGSVVVIDFWATWCHACKDAAPALERLHRKYGERGLVVLGITLDSGFRAEENVRGFAKKHGMV